MQKLTVTLDPKTLRSPCVAQCKLNHDEICTGCHRTIDEILTWSSSSDETKRQIIKRITEVQNNLT